MKIKSPFLVPAFALIGIALAFVFEKPLSARQKFGLFLREHPYNNRGAWHTVDEEPGADHPDRAWEQDFMRTMNPALGRPTPELLPAIISRMRSAPTTGTMNIPGNASSPWQERGPNNVG